MNLGQLKRAKQMCIWMILDVTMCIMSILFHVGMLNGYKDVREMQRIRKLLTIKLWINAADEWLLIS